MNVFRVMAIPTETADSVRATLKSPRYGFPAHRELATGRAPCRHCLQLIRKDREELLLFTYDPFHELGTMPWPGPVYLHANACPRHTEDSEFPDAYRGRLLTLCAYGEERALLKEAHVKDGEEQTVAENLFVDPRVKYIHVRSTEAGCYLFRLERTE
jgi:hypothetical protein